MTHAPELFREAVAALEAVRPRSEVTLESVRAPQRLAPWAYALSCDVTGEVDVPATGRLVLLHDPEGPEAWRGVLRLVVYVRAGLDRELASDPFLPTVGWSWLTDALECSGASWTALGGTVTETSSARFGELADQGRSDDLELRASWTPTDAKLQPHGEAFLQLMSSVAGLPPVGVTAFRQTS
ncbi:membrane protein [Amycolatopsis taiwanensis]|uniref:Membrane protein n=2 Tax=Amycolatopsis taiwanensis TaxID=342230 RepID=A0A9W6R8Y7_9PSEU|nr:membrane protein [Amycolatopsis taiwanensis]